MAIKICMKIKKMAKRKRRRNLRYLPSIPAEQQRQAAQLANPNDPVDATAFFQNLPPSLRQAILTDMEDSQIASLPPDLVAEATVATAGSSNRAETTPLTSVAAAAAAREAEIQRRDQKKFMKFVETHRTVLNQILRQSATHLSDGLFSVLVDHPRILDFDMKRKYFRTELEHMDEEVRREELTVNVRRVTAFEDSFRGLYRRGPEEWKNRIYIVFEDEEGQEAGGLLREWYIIILREIFNPMYALFCVSPGDRVTYMINPSSHANPNHLCYFKFVGRVLVKAIHDNKLLDCFFARSFFKHILGIQVKYTDMESQDYEFYKGLAYLMSNDISTIGYDLTFSTEVQEFGVTQICSDIFTITRRPLGGGSSTAAASASAALSNTLDLTINDRMPSRNSASRTSVRSIATDPKELETTDSVALEGAELKAATAGSSNKVETTPSTSVAHTAAAREADIQCRDQKKFLEIAEKHHTRKYFRSELEGMDEGARRFFVLPVKLPSIFTVTGCKNFNKAAVSFSMIFEKMYISLLFRMSLADNTNLKKMEQLKKRGTRVSKTQKESMIMFMLENKDFARGQISTAEGSRCTQELWAILSKRLNSLGPNIKTIDQWKKCWTDIKSTTKTKWTSRKKFLYGTGGGSSSDGPPDLTEMDEKVMEIITISAVDGDGSTPEITGETQIMSVEVELPQEMEEEVFTLATPKKAPDYVKSAFEEAKGMHDSLQNTLDEIKQQIATLVSQNEKIIALLEK